jgi:outer membrane protein assembly factor BamE (lipoprotein component of BamABCDE complex)
LPPTPGVTYANYSRIEQGMTQEEVEALFGKPNTKRLKLVDWIIALDDVWFENVVGPWQNWESEDGALVSVQFDDQGRVVATAWDGTQDERSALEKLRDRLPWVAHRPPVGKINMN